MSKTANEDDWLLELGKNAVGKSGGKGYSPNLFKKVYTARGYQQAVAKVISLC